MKDANKRLSLLKSVVEAEKQRQDEAGIEEGKTNIEVRGSAIVEIPADIFKPDAQHRRLVGSVRSPW